MPIPSAHPPNTATVSASQKESFMAKKKSTIAKVVETVEGWVGMKPKKSAKKKTEQRSAKKKTAKKARRKR